MKNVIVIMKQFPLLQQKIVLQFVILGNLESIFLERREEMKAR